MLSSGYRYIVTGDYVNSGIPLVYIILDLRRKKTNILDRTKMKTRRCAMISSVVKAVNGESVVVPNCFQCHAEFSMVKLVVGLGNSNRRFTKTKKFEDL